MDVVRDFRRGAVRLHVLHHAAAGEVSGAWMSEELGRHGYRISPGTLYPLLHDLERSGLLASSQRVEAGRVVRFYTITDAGRESLDEARYALAELASELLPARSKTRRAGQGRRGEPSRRRPEAPRDPGL
jgi:DNA-binding PadR family transcriptional regulator